MFSEKTTFTFPIILLPIKDISIQIYSFSTLFVRNGRYFVNEFLSLSILNLLRLYSIWKYPLFIRYDTPFFPFAVSVLMY